MELLDVMHQLNSSEEKVKRNEILKLEKLLAEGGQEEIKIILG